MAKRMHACNTLLGAVLTMAIIAGLPSIYTVANLLGINLAPGWYQAIVSYVSAGGTIAQAFLTILGVVVPEWILTVVAGFGRASA